MTVARARTVAAAPEEVWRLVTDPERLPEWWPSVQRVEEATSEAWTKVLMSKHGKAVRADYTLAEIEPLRRVVWRQEVEESPFERILAQSLTDIALEPAEEGTRVEITARLKPRGFARFGFFQLRLATTRQLEGALDGLAAALEG